MVRFSVKNGQILVRFSGKIGQIVSQIFANFSQILIVSTLQMNVTKCPRLGRPKFFLVNVVYVVSLRNIINMPRYP